MDTINSIFETYEKQAIIGNLIQAHSDSAPLDGGWNHSNSADTTKHTNCHSNAVNRTGHCDVHVNQ